jgi:hypothetical protein
MTGGNAREGRAGDGGDFNESKEALTSEVKSAISRRLAKERDWMISKAGLGRRVKSAVVDIMDSSSNWGWWDSESRRIVLSERLVLDHPWNVVLGVLGHETAHQAAWDISPARAMRESAHGSLFMLACDMLRLHPFYRKATIDLLENGPPPSIFNRMDPDVPDHPVLEKVRKLLALSSSPEPNEAAQALAMASRLMARHNIDAAQVKPDSDECPYERWRISLNSTRVSSVDTGIIDILQKHFFVTVIMVWEYDRKALAPVRQIELLGRPVNLHMARHVFHFLRERTETLWQANKRNLALMGEKGLKAKHSFINGMLQTFNEKLAKSQKAPFQGQVMPSSEVILAGDAKLREFVDYAYPRLKSFYSCLSSDSPNSVLAGSKAGAELNIYSPVTGSGGDGGGPVKYLEHRRGR